VIFPTKTQVSVEQTDKNMCNNEKMKKYNQYNSSN